MARRKLPVHTPGERTLHPGDEGSDVAAVQAALGLEVTGVYDEVTQAAVKRLQRLRGVPQQGVLGPATWPFLLDAATQAQVVLPTPGAGEEQAAAEAVQG